MTPINETSSLTSSYESLNLIEVVVDTDDKINQTALELFGESYKKLIDKLYYKPKLVQASYVSPFLGLVTTTGLGINLAVNPSHDHLYWFLGSIAGILFSIIPPVAINACYGERAADFVDAAHAITVFYNDFVDFQNHPGDINFSKLLETFEKLQKKESIQYGDSNDFILFQPAGKLLLMDAIVRVFEQRFPKTMLVQKWNNFDPSNSKDWETMGMEMPDLCVWNEFINLSKQVKSIEIANKIVECFKKVLDKNITENTI